MLHFDVVDVTVGRFDPRPLQRQTHLRDAAARQQREIFGERGPEPDAPAAGRQVSGSGVAGSGAGSGTVEGSVRAADSPSDPVAAHPQIVPAAGDPTGTRAVRERPASPRVCRGKAAGSVLA